MGARFDLADIQNLPEWARKQIAAKMDEQRDRDISKLATMIENSHGNQKSATQEQKQELAKESKYRARKTQRSTQRARQSAMMSSRSC